VLARNGALAVLAARRVDRLKELRAEIEAAGGAAHVVALDVADPAAITVAVAQVEAAVGPIDVLVNNAGMSIVQRLVDVSPVDFDLILGTNVRGAFFMAQAVARRMIARAKDQPDFRGRIINVGSVAGLRALPQLGVYAMSKAAVVHMTRAQAVEWGRYGINVNAICPGYIRTELNDEHWDTDAGRKLLQMLPRRRIGNAADLDGLLLLLAADESQFINGAIVTADDGLSVS
jgi:NAD(P)-dependent dehydrogenase (short-subunit alcohol dehydrogenase family)